MNDDDLHGFLDFYAMRFREQHGHEPSKATLVGKYRQVRAALTASGCSTIAELALVVSDRDLSECLWSVRKRTMSSGAQRTALYALRDFGNFAIELGVATGNHFEPLAMPARNRRNGISTFSDEEMRLIHASAQFSGDTRWACLLTFLALTGRRIGETLSLEWKDVRCSDTTPNVTFRQTKAGVSQTIPIGPRVRETVFTFENESEWRSATFLRPEQRGRGGYHRDPSVFVFPWSYKTVRARLERLCLGESIPYRPFHEFRRTRITEWLVEGVPMQAVAALAGHSVQTMERYYNATTAMTFWRYVNDGPATIVLRSGPDKADQPHGGLGDV